MSDTGFFPFLAEGPVHGRAEPAELRQTICPRLSGDARLGQDSACPASAERSDRKKFGEVRRGVSPPDGWRLGGRVSIYPLGHAVMLGQAKRLWFPLVVSSEVETSRGKT